MNQLVNFAAVQNTNNLIGGNQSYELHVSEPWFTLILLGLKTIEGRKNKGIFKTMNIDDVIEWKNDDFIDRRVKTRVVRKAVYDTFENYLNSEGLQNCLPGIYTIEDGVKVYYKYFTKEDEQTYGVVALELRLI